MRRARGGTRCSSSRGSPGRPRSGSTRRSVPSRPRISRSAARSGTARFETGASPSRSPARSGRSPSTRVPRLIAADEWETIESGVAQRVRALERFLADVYGRGEVFDDGVVPRRLVATSRHFHRAAAGIEIAERRPDPRRRDRPRPRRERRVPGARGQRPHPLRGLVRRREPPDDGPDLPRAVREPPRPAGRRLPQRRSSPRCGRRPAPTRRGDPTVVVLTPGVHNSAYFEHSFLARQMGVELVEGRDLVCRQNVLYMRTTERRAARRRRLPARRRRLPRPAPLPAGLAARLRRAPQRGPGRQRHDRERGRQRRRRRQARLHLRARAHPLLPRRAADPQERRHLPARGPRPARPRARSHRRARR